MTSPEATTLPLVLAIGGSDCSAGAGIQTDLKTLHTLGVYGLTAITGVVAESPHEVKSWNAVSPKLLTDQLECLFQAYPISVVKVGLLFNSDLVHAVSKALKGKNVVVVVDPVGSASTGTDFGGKPLREALATELFPLTSLLTPNLLEARQFTESSAGTADSLAIELSKKFSLKVLVKGGHDTDLKLSTDYYADGDALISFEKNRLNTPDYHGTGCTLSSAISAYIAKGESVTNAISQAKSFLHDAMRTGHEWDSPLGQTHALNVFP